LVISRLISIADRDSNEGESEKERKKLNEGKEIKKASVALTT